MTSTKAVAKIAEPQLPDLAPTTQMEIGSEDVSLPRLYMGQPNGDAVQEGRVPAHCLWVGLGADDIEPNIIWTQDDPVYDPTDEKTRAATKDAGVLIHVLAVTKGLSAEIGGELRSFRFGDPDAPPTGKEKGQSQFTYNYVLCLPEVDPDVPVKLLLKSTSATTAKRINFQLMKAASTQPAHALAFRLHVTGKKKESSGTTYRYSIMEARKVDAVPANVQIADAMVQMLDSSTVETVPVGDEPAI